MQLFLGPLGPLVSALYVSQTLSHAIEIHSLSATTGGPIWPWGLVLNIVP